MKNGPTVSPVAAIILVVVTVVVVGFFLFRGVASGSGSDASGALPMKGDIKNVNPADFEGVRQELEKAKGTQGQLSGGGR